MISLLRAHLADPSTGVFLLVRRCASVQGVHLVRGATAPRPAFAAYVARKLDGLQVARLHILEAPSCVIKVYAHHFEVVHLSVSIHLSLLAPKASGSREGLHHASQREG